MAKTNTVKFSDEEMRLIQNAASQVWDEVAYDCLIATAEDKGKDPNSITIPRSQVIEIALDAGRPEEILKERTRKMDPALRADFLARWESLDYATRIKVVKPAFSYTRYGL